MDLKLDKISLQKKEPFLKALLSHASTASTSPRNTVDSAINVLNKLSNKSVLFMYVVLSVTLERS